MKLANLEKQSLLEITARKINKQREELWNVSIATIENSKTLKELETL